MQARLVRPLRMRLDVLDEMALKRQLYDIGRVREERQLKQNAMAAQPSTSPRSE